ncbi:MAG TPA: Gfo/Idh/MocA family oxidoreductase [Bacteroidota bacterium]|nr:Gfo/Idh/MocA family oxidoreductase [Bacteroidota bacterium]
MMRKIRYGIIGFGAFAEKAILPAIRRSRNSEIVAIQKRDIAQARLKAEEYGVPHAFDTADQLVKSTDVDAVFIVSANSAHCAETLMAASAKKHVIVEKPMAMNCAEAQRMIDACRTAGIVFSVAHMLRFSPLLNRMKELIASDEIGAIVSFRSEFIYDASISKRSWLFERKSAGGGPTYDIAVHCLDALRFILDDEVVKTHGVVRPVPTELRTESSSLISLQFAKGAIGSIFTSFETPVKRTLIECIGRNAMLTAYDFTVSNATPTLRIERGEAGRTTEITEERFAIPDLYELEITHHSDCILNGSRSIIGGENGLKNQIVLDAALFS